MTKCRKKSFVKNSTEGKIGKIKSYEINLTLLPHQTLILPEYYLEILNYEFLTNYKLIDNNQMR